MKVYSPETKGWKEVDGILVPQKVDVECGNCHWFRAPYCHTARPVASSWGSFPTVGIKQFCAQFLVKGKAR